MESRVDLRLVFAAGFGDVRLAAAGAADEFGDRADKFAGLDALDQAGRDAGDDGDFAFGLRGGEHHNALAELLLQVVDQRAQLAALERVGAMRKRLSRLSPRVARATASSRPPAADFMRDLFEFAAEALEFVFLGGELGARGLR